MNLDPFDYFPLREEKIPASSAGMKKFSKLPIEKRQIFQKDENFDWYMENKRKCKQENLSKYYQKLDGYDIGIIEDYLRGDFEWVAEQVQEDLVVCKVNDDGSTIITHIHLMSPNGWAAEWAIGKSFADMHEHVLKASGAPVIRFPDKVALMIMRLKEPIERLGALSFREEAKLNRHPDDYKKYDWETFNELYLRFERQVVVSFPKINSFLFTIKTYFNDLTKSRYRNPAIKAIKNCHKNAYPRDWVQKHGERAIKFLENKNEQKISKTNQIISKSF